MAHTRETVIDETQYLLHVELVRLLVYLIFSGERAVAHSLMTCAISHVIKILVDIAEGKPYYLYKARL